MCRIISSGSCGFWDNRYQEIIDTSPGFRLDIGESLQDVKYFWKENYKIPRGEVSVLQRLRRVMTQRQVGEFHLTSMNLESQRQWIESCAREHRTTQYLFAVVAILVALQWSRLLD
jgi:hypothetical protein